MKVHAVIQARMGSTRFPGKVLADINGKPMLRRQIERLMSSPSISQVVVATSTHARDDALSDLCAELGAACHRGSEENVLDRVASFAKRNPDDLLVECFGDSPLLSPDLIELGLDMIRSEDSSRMTVVTNNFPQSYPSGMEVLIYPAKALIRLDKLISSEDPMREHVGSNFRRFTTDFSFRSFSASSRHRRPDLFLEVDEPIDLRVVASIFEHFDASHGEPSFSLDEILDFCDSEPELFRLNKDVHRRWKDSYGN